MKSVAKSGCRGKGGIAFSPPPPRFVLANASITLEKRRRKIREGQKGESRTKFYLLIEIVSHAMLKSNFNILLVNEVHIRKTFFNGFKNRLLNTKQKIDFWISVEIDN